MTDDRLLTHADLSAIEARAEANYRILAPDVQSVPDTTWYVAQDNYPTNPLILAARALLEGGADSEGGA